MKEKDSKSSRADSFASYADYNRTLRTWLVAFGIGAPVLFLTNEKLSEKLISAPNAKCIVFAFLAGCFAQVIIALINKITNWCEYYGEIAPEFKKKHYYIVADYVGRQFLIDFTADVITIGLFFYSVYSLFDVFLATPIIPTITPPAH